MNTRHALISAADKSQVPELAEALHATGLSVVSLGATAECMRDAGIPVTETAALLEGAGVDLVRKAEEDERDRREVAAVHLARFMSWGSERLDRHGLPEISFAYINLMPPTVESNRNGARPGIKSDKGGRFMIEAAIEGGRNIIVSPAQLGRVIGSLQTGEPLPDDLLEETRGHLRAYEQAVDRLAGSLAVGRKL